MKRLVAILVTSGALATAGAALAPVAFADPANPDANCVGHAASTIGGDEVAFEAQIPHSGYLDMVGLSASTNCFSR